MSTTLDLSFRGGTLTNIGMHIITHAGVNDCRSNCGESGRSFVAVSARGEKNETCTWYLEPAVAERLWQQLGELFGQPDSAPESVLMGEHNARS